MLSLFVTFNSSTHTSLHLGMQHALRMRHIVICALPGSTVISLVISLTARFSKKERSLNTKCLFFPPKIVVRNFHTSKKNSTKIFSLMYMGTHYLWGTWWSRCLRHCDISRKVAGSIPDGVIGIFH